MAWLRLHDTGLRAHGCSGLLVCWQSDPVYSGLAQEDYIEACRSLGVREVGRRDVTHRHLQGWLAGGGRCLRLMLPSLCHLSSLCVRQDIDEQSLKEKVAALLVKYEDDRRKKIMIEWNHDKILEHRLFMQLDGSMAVSPSSPLDHQPHHAHLLSGDRGAPTRHLDVLERGDGSSVWWLMVPWAVWLWCMFVVD